MIEHEMAWATIITGDRMTNQVGGPRDKIVGPHQTCPEQSMVPAGEAATGFICATWYGTGTHFPLI
jgi:branched-chain amino acid transport system substrate-binding protein